MLKRVEKYEIIGEIGHGGMATVYRARDTRLDREVALKVMHPHLQGSREAKQRFAREAVTVARIRNPAILEIYDYSGEDSEIAFIATELLTGPTLKVFAEQHSDMPAEIAACLALQVARALSAAHAEGIVHRDVKPENVLLHENRGIKLTDFGIAQLVDMQSMPTTGQVLGSPAHMAPEQVEGKECDARSDLFALGTVLYLLATGELPFSGQNAHQVLKRIVDGKFRDPLQVRPAIGNRLASMIRKLLELDPAKRYATAAELERDLLAFVTESGIESPEDAVARYLSDPEGYGATLRAQLVLKLTELGEQAQARGEVPVALEHWNRVLALDDGNARVLAGVQRLGQRAAMRRRMGRVAAFAGIAVLLATPAYLALRPFGGRAREVPALKPSLGPPAASAGTGTGTGTGASAPRPVVRLPSVTEPPRPPRAPHSDRPRVPARPANPSVSPDTPRAVTFNPFPANVAIGVDGGEPRAFGPSFREVTLPPGMHRFKFVGAQDCCLDEEITVRVPAGEGSFTVTQRLKFRPAGLYVVTDPPVAANVVVDGGPIGGRNREVIEIPDMAQLMETHTVRITAVGHEDQIQEVRVQAGQVVTVDVTMKKRTQDS
jgi:serine/threonine-protein kinase